MQPDIIPEGFLEEGIIPRNKLIPLWIKIFSWMFLIFGFVVFIGLMFGILGYNFEMALYGFETNIVFSYKGILIMLLFFVKGIVAFGIITKKDWAVKLAIVDGIIGIALCAYTMIFQTMIIRLELIALIPYLLKMRKIKMAWESNLS